MSSQPAFLESAAALRDFLRAFETPSLGKGEWTHAAHVAMAAVYLRRHGDGVLAPTRAAIQRFNASVGGPPTAYHETLTVLWLGIVAEVLDGAACADDLSAARLAVTRFGAESKRHALYYSFDIVKTEHARTGWVAPDVRPIAIPFTVTTAG